MIDAPSAPARPSAAPGAIHHWSRTLIPTTREAPADAEAPSHVLLSRAGYIRKVGAGIYDYLPLAWRVLKKISAIVRQEMDAAGACEVALPTLVPIELYAGTRRDADYGDLLFKLTDRKGAVAALGPTHEETVTELVKGSVTSYKQLPLNLYQVTTKFRDEARPRSGLLRCREFIMKDAYSFHLAVDGPGGLNEAYDAMYAAYVNIFRRCGLDFTVVEAESGPIGGSASHEFMVNCATGEDTILRCPVSGYAANVEKCDIGERPAPPPGFFAGQPTGPLQEVHTPACPGIDDVCALLGVKPRHMLKSLVFTAQAPPGSHDPARPDWIIAVVRGDHDVNEGKVRDLVGRPVRLANPVEAAAAGFAIGFVSPRAAATVPSTTLLVDRDAAVGWDAAAGKPMFWVTGADKPDFHVKHFNWERDLGKDPHRAALPGGRHAPGLLGGDPYIIVADIRNAMAGDPSPRAPGATLQTARGIEVGHIFKLGSKYSDAMGFTILDERQQKRSVIMGCYGIGVSRTMAACVEMSHDADGIIWPAAIAPYHVLLTVMKPAQPDQAGAAARLAADLAAAGLDVLVDDRDERPGVKFKDADLVGIPIRLTIGDKALAAGAVEFKRRADPSRGESVPIDAAVRRCADAAAP
jgi:prolyl-tRNA synthetase